MANLSWLLALIFTGWAFRVSAQGDGQELHTLQARAEQAKDWVSSKKARRFYQQLTCQTENPPRGLDNYEKYCEGYRAAIRHNRRTLTTPAKEWFRTKRPKNLPRTILYPFARTDLTTSLTIFPAQIRHALIRLKTPLKVTYLYPLETAEQLQLLDKLVQETLKDLLYDGYSTSPILPQSGKRERRVDPLSRILIGLAIHRGELVSFRHFVITKSGTIRYLENPRSKRERMHFELAFRLPGDTAIRILQHVTVELANSVYEAPETPHVRQWVRSLGPVSLLVKASDYLLWTRRYNVFRSDLIRQAQWMVADSSGILPWRLKRRPWAWALYGQYRCPFEGENFKLAMRQENYVESGKRLAALLRTRRKGPLPFRFGYLDCQFGAHVIFGRPVSEESTHKRGDEPAQ